MKLLTHRTLAIVFAAALAATTISRQSAQKQTFIPPPQAQAPAITPASKAPEQPPAKSAKPALEPQPKATPAAQPTRSDPVADLIARVEKEYQAGEANHQAGHLDAAANLLLNSGFDLRSDERLEKELERVLEGSNSLESVAQQQSDSSDQQKSEPAPIDEANEATPAVDANVKAKAEAEIKSTRSDLPLMMTDQVAGYINFYSTRGRGTLERALARSGRYDEMMRRVLKEEGVPQDLIYLAQAESGFHPLAVSRVGARGMWQFMGS